MAKKAYDDLVQEYGNQSCAQIEIYVADVKEPKNDNSSEIDNEADETVQKLIDEAKLTFKGPVYAAYDLYCYKV